MFIKIDGRIVNAEQIADFEVVSRQIKDLPATVINNYKILLVGTKQSGGEVHVKMIVETTAKLAPQAVIDAAGYLNEFFKALASGKSFDIADVMPHSPPVDETAPDATPLFKETPKEGILVDSQVPYVAPTSPGDAPETPGIPSEVDPLHAVKHKGHSGK